MKRVCSTNVNFIFEEDSESMGYLEQEHARGKVVNIVAIPAAGYLFVGWSGDCYSNRTSCQVTMNYGKKLTAHFTKAPVKNTDPSLKMFVSPSGSGSVSAGGDSRFALGTSVTVTATPATGYRFASWSGDCTGSGSCMVVMDSLKSVTANFTKDPVTPSTGN